LTFLLSAAVLLPLPALRPTDAAGQVAPRATRGFVAGLRYLRTRPYLAVVISLKSCMALGGGSLAMLPVFGTRVFPETAGAAYIGLLYTARGLGALVGSMLLPRIFGDAPGRLRRFVAPALVLVAASHLAVSQAENVWQAAGAYFGTAVGGGAIWVASSTLGQLAAANEYRGRVFSVEWGMMTLVLSAVAALAGVIVDHTAWTARDVALLSGLLVLLPAAGWAGFLGYVRAGLARMRRERSAASGGAALEQAHARWRERWIGGEDL
jgi:hypothetical protein